MYCVYCTGLVLLGSCRLYGLGIFLFLQMDIEFWPLRYLSLYVLPYDCQSFLCTVCTVTALPYRGRILYNRKSVTVYCVYCNGLVLLGSRRLYSLEIFLILTYCYWKFCPLRFLYFFVSSVRSSTLSVYCVYCTLRSTG